MFFEPRGHLKDRVVNRKVNRDAKKPARLPCVRAFLFQLIRYTLVIILIGKRCSTYCNCAKQRVLRRNLKLRPTYLSSRGK